MGNDYHFITCQSAELLHIYCVHTITLTKIVFLKTHKTRFRYFTILIEIVFLQEVCNIKECITTFSLF